MKLKLSVFLLLGTLIAQVQAAESFTDPKEKLSYGFGFNVGTAWKAQDLDIMELNLDLVIKGIKDAMAGNPGSLKDEEVRELMNTFRTELRTKQEGKKKILAEKNKQAGAAFLAENKNKPGVITLPSGLQYKVITEGNGPIPKGPDTVTVNYKGTLINGTEFDSSYSRGQPATFGVTGVIPGWTEALQKMKAGSKWQLFIPSELAYGDQGYGRKIEPGSTLIFEIDLMSVKVMDPPPLPQPVTSDIIKVPSAEELKKGAQIEIIKPDQIKEQTKEQPKKP